MATVSDIVQRAFHKIGALGVGDTLEADEAEIGRDALNEMLHSWKLRDVDITHSDLDLSDTFPMADEYREGVVYNLALRLSPEFTIPASFDAEAWFRNIQAAYLTMVEASMPPGLYQMPSQTDRST